MTRLAGRRLVAMLAATLVWSLTAFAQGGEEARTIELKLENGALPRDQRVIRVHQGEPVELRWVTDRRVTIHLHGYDIERTLTPGAPTSMRFQARATGRFPIALHGGAGKKSEAHGHEETIGYLEVHPR